MGRLTTEYCVEIRVPKKNSDKNKFGTGYTLGPHWVLTAYHVLFGDDVDATKDIKITWWDETAENIKGEKPVPVERKDIVWWHKEHDIALIRCESPYADIPGAWELIDANYPDTRAGCESSGFLSNLDNKNGKQRRKDPAGTLGSFNQEQITVDIDQLSVNCSIEPEKYWQGFSGSAVFVAGKFVAIVRSVNTGENGLTASFISAALDSKGEGADQPALRDIPGFFIAPNRKKCWKRVQKQVTDALTDTVYKALKKDYLDKIDREAKINNAAALAELLFREENIKVIKLFSRVSTAMRKQQQVQEVCIMKDLASIWLVLMAAEQGNICGAEGFKENASAQSLDIKAVEPVLLDVEAQAANAENRNLHVRLVGKDLRSPLDLTPGSTVGFDKDDRQAAKDAKDKYNRKTKLGFEVFTVDEAKDALEKFATRPESGLSSPLSPDDDRQRGLEIHDQLEWACEELEEELEEKISYYIRLAEPVNQDSCLYGLHKWCPQLLVFAVSSSDNRERKNCLSGLHRIIHRAEIFLNEQYQAEL